MVIRHLQAIYFPAPSRMVIRYLQAIYFLGPTGNGNTPPASYLLSSPQKNGNAPPASYLLSRPVRATHQERHTSESRGDTHGDTHPVCHRTLVFVPDPPPVLAFLGIQAQNERQKTYRYRMPHVMTHVTCDTDTRHVCHSTCVTLEGAISTPRPEPPEQW